MIDAGSQLLMDVLTPSIPIRERNLIIDTALRNAGLLEAPTQGADLRDFVTGPVRHAAVTHLGETKGELLAVYVMEALGFNETDETAVRDGKTLTLPRAGAPRAHVGVAQPRRVGQGEPSTTRDYEGSES